MSSETETGPVAHDTAPRSQKVLYFPDLYPVQRDATEIKLYGKKVVLGTGIKLQVKKKGIKQQQIKYTKYSYISLFCVDASQIVFVDKNCVVFPLKSKEILSIQ